MKDGDAPEFGRKWLLARFVAEHATPDKGTDAPAEKGKAEQGRFRDPPCPRLGTQLVKAQQHERPCVEKGDCAEDERWVEHEGHRIGRGGFGKV
jgi:hypothetical protein